jgi:hypothetical protein
MRTPNSSDTEPDSLRETKYLLLEPIFPFLFPDSHFCDFEILRYDITFFLCEHHILLSVKLPLLSTTDVHMTVEQTFENVAKKRIHKNIVRAKLRAILPSL